MGLGLAISCIAKFLLHLVMMHLVIPFLISSIPHHSHSPPPPTLSRESASAPSDPEIPFRQCHNLQDELAHLRKQLEAAKPADADCTKEAALTAPSEFSCPITYELFCEPVVCSDGFTYERFVFVFGDCDFGVGVGVGVNGLVPTS